MLGWRSARREVDGPQTCFTWQLHHQLISLTVRHTVAVLEDEVALQQDIRVAPIPHGVEGMSRSWPLLDVQEHEILADVADHYVHTILQRQAVSLYHRGCSAKCN